MALIGGALSLGFIVGPLVGGLLAGGDKTNADFTLVALFCAGMNALALVGTITMLPELLNPEMIEKLKNRPHASRWQSFEKIRAKSGLFMMFLAALAFGTGGSVFELSFPLWGKDAMDLGPREVGWALSFAGVIMVAMQLGVQQSKIGTVMNKRFNETQLATAACAIYAVGLVLIATCNSWTQLLLAQVCLPMGLALFNPNISSLVSKQAEPTERGMVMGFYASWGSLARGAGPLFSGALLQADLRYPYFYEVIAMVITVALIALAKSKAPPAPAGANPQQAKAA